MTFCFSYSIKKEIRPCEFKKKVFSFVSEIELTFYTLYCVCSLWSKIIFSLDEFLKFSKWNIFTNGSSVKRSVERKYERSAVLCWNYCDQVDTFQKTLAKYNFIQTCKCFPFSNWRQIRENKIILGNNTVHESVATRKMKPWYWHCKLTNFFYILIGTCVKTFT